MKNKKVVWALFDDAEMSVYKTLGDEYEVHSIGINDNDVENYHKIDLSISNPNLIKELSKLPQPHVILASPPCESWSWADTTGTLLSGIQKDILPLRTHITLHNELYYNVYNEMNTKNKKFSKCRDFYQKMGSFMIGLNTATATAAIIKHFWPLVWVIENPRNSRIWKFIQHMLDLPGFENVATYNAYDENFSLKPTTFFSNIEMELKTDYKGKRNKNYYQNGTYKKRSAIPEELLKHISQEIQKEIKEYELIN